MKQKPLKNISSYFSFVLALNMIDAQMLFWSMLHNLVVGHLVTSSGAYFVTSSGAHFVTSSGAHTL